MVKLIATIKAIITRIFFGAHGALAIWQVTQYKKDPLYWTLSVPIVLLVFEGIFTLGIKKNQEWRWFCPSVFLYLSSVVPAIWLLELDKVERRHKIREETFSLAAAAADLKELDKLLGVNIKLPELNVDAETWITLIEQFLMLILIIGRWLLPKGDLTRDQLSQLLLVYIGTAADIIEFFDSFKEKKIADEPILVFLTLSIWSWSLMQFTIVLTATRARKPRGATSDATADEESITCCSDCCCSLDIWGIAFNIILQDAPFLTFRLLIIIHYQIISYMNVFFTCKNTLVILLQLYRLYVVQSESNKAKSQKKKLKYQQHRQKHAKGGSGRGGHRRHGSDDIYIISNERNGKHKKRKCDQDSNESDYHDDDGGNRSSRKKKITKSIKKDTGYSTGGSSHEEKKKKMGKRKQQRKDDESPSPERSTRKQQRQRTRESSPDDDEKSKRHQRSRRDKIAEQTEDEDENNKEKATSSRKKSRKKRSASSRSSSSKSSRE